MLPGRCRFHPKRLVGNDQCMAAIIRFERGNIDHIENSDLISRIQFHVKSPLGLEFMFDSDCQLYKVEDSGYIC